MDCPTFLKQYWRDNQHNKTIFIAFLKDYLAMLKLEVPRRNGIMNLRDDSTSGFTRSIWLTLGVFVVFAIVFALYAYSEKRIDRANELRLQSHMLAGELRQSSDDLTRMVRSYVITGKPIYKQHYQEILDIRDGRKPRPAEYQNIYWDLVQADDQRPHPSSGQAIALLELMRQAGFTAEEFSLLAQAKAKSDALTSTEFAAMKLVEASDTFTEANRQKPSQMLYDAAYHQAKASIMRPISEFNQMMDRRTLDAVHAAETSAALLRLAFILIGLLLLFMLWQLHRSLHATLGSSVDELHARIARLGSGDLSSGIPLAKGMENSVLGWLSATQIKLAEINAARNDAEARSQRMTQLYAALSQCNQAILRCSSEAELFPQICLDAVTFGGMKMAWIGMIDEQSKQLGPVAFYGSGTDYLQGLQISVDAGDPTAHGPTGTAIRKNQPFWCQDFQHDPVTELWHERGARFGWGAAAALPLHRNGVVVGAFTLYSSEANAFDEAARNLLVEMAMDIDYALGNFEREIQRKQAEDQLRIAAVAFDTDEAIMITDADANIIRVNRAFERITGYSEEEVKGKNPRILSSGRHNKSFYAKMWQDILSTGTWNGEIWDKGKSGNLYPKQMTISAVKNDQGQTTQYVSIFTDISERKQSEQRIEELAFYDQLTGLPNRVLLLDRLRQAMTASTRSRNYGALLLLDLDGFKNVNDTLGHDMGDLLLKQVAQRLISCVRADDTVARVGGDEFLVMLPNLGTSERDAASRIEIVGEKIRAVLSQAYQLNDVVSHSTPSIGVTLFKGHQAELDDLLKQADLAMYKSKEAGRNTLHFFDPDMESAVMKRAALEKDLREAINEKQFLLHYQAQVVDDNRLTGAEVLVRWQHPERGLVSPADFIPLAEETGLILSLGHWVLQTACTQLAVWAIRPDMAHLTIAVNVSAHQFRQDDFVDQVLAVLNSTGANPQRLKLELTESMLASNIDEIIEKMSALRAKGVGFSLDDFGTGYSSLSYLKRLPLDQLKIDQSFVRDVLSDTNDASIAKTIVALAQNLGLGVIAEGVETTAQRDFLASAGCHAYQGYFFSRPLPLEGFEKFAQKVV